VLLFVKRSGDGGAIAGTTGTATAGALGETTSRGVDKSRDSIKTGLGKSRTWATETRDRLHPG
jgi:hypothetical protein